MSRVMRNGHQRGAVSLGAVLVVLALGVAPAWGARMTPPRANFATTLSGAAPGETIELSGLCGGTPDNSFPLPNVANLTIEGAAAGDGFDGTGAAHGALTGTAPSGLTLRNLTFENYALTNESALQLQLTSPSTLPVIDHDSFLNNKNTSTTTPAGGALDIFGADTTCPYTGSLTISNSQFSGNTLITTSTTSSPGSGVTGGGASISVECASPATASLVITGNTFKQNSIQTAGATALGAGLYAANAEPGQITATQSGNVFQSNSIVNTGSTATTFDGGGEWLASVNLTRRRTRTSATRSPVQERARRARARVSARCAATARRRPARRPPPRRTLVAAGNTISTPSGTGRSRARASTQAAWRRRETEGSS